MPSIKGFVDPALTDGFDEGTLEGAYNMYASVIHTIKQLREDWDHIESATQVLDVLIERLGEDNK